MQYNLMIWRKENNITQKQMADMLGISEKQYGYKERGQNQFTLDEMFKISQIVGKPLDYIFLPRTHQIKH